MMETERTDRRTTVIARTVIRIVVPIIIVTAIAITLQGHNKPGGGFIGAVLTATAFVLIYVIFGLDYIKGELLAGTVETDQHGPVEWYRWLFAAGLTLAAGSGMVPILFGRPFMTQSVLFVEHVPLYGEMEFAWASTFDIGVYCAVVGALLTIIGEVGNE
ncbi:MAG: MnhB domain-containing protein [Haloferacaceae archaeon]